MARAGRAKKKPIVRVEHIDATPERIRMDESEWVNPAEIDSGEQGITLTRRFRASHLDRLYRKEDPKSPLTWEQWNAGNWYRNTHARCGFSLSVVAAYGERTSASERSFGLARTEQQLHARLLWRAARNQWPQGMLGFMDRFLLHDALPRYAGSAHVKSIRQIADALEHLAGWMRDVSPMHIIEQKSVVA